MKAISVLTFSTILLFAVSAIAADNVVIVPEISLLLSGGKDCNGVKDGTAYLDNCSICVGGDTGKTSCVQDCNGDWGGTAYENNCSTCVGGNTGVMEFNCITNGTTGKTWMDRNLGASQVATSSNDSLAYGDLYQWGRGTDGHEKRASAPVNSQSASDVPGHGDFIFGFPDWLSSPNTTLWQGVSGTNNPCPGGFRLPTETEWQTEIDSWGVSPTAADAFASPLKLVRAGIRHYNDGTLDVGNFGYYWSSNVFGSNSRTLYFYSNGAYVGSLGRASGFSVRCLKD